MAKLATPAARSRSPSPAWPRSGSWSLVVSIVALLTILITSLLSAPGAIADQNDPALDELFAELQEETKAGRARQIAKQIWEAWTASGDNEVDAQMEFAAQAMSVRHYRLALYYLHRVVLLAPDYSEGWNRRATVYYLAGEYQRSLKDVDKTLQLEPRHFGALSGRGVIYMRLQKYTEAIEAFQDALRQNPHLKNAKENLRRAERALYGEPI